MEWDILRQTADAITDAMREYPPDLVTTAAAIVAVEGLIELGKDPRELGPPIESIYAALEADDLPPRR